MFAIIITKKLSGCFLTQCRPTVSETHSRTGRCSVGLQSRRLRRDQRRCCTHRHSHTICPLRSSRSLMTSELNAVITINTYMYCMHIAQSEP